MRLLTAIFGTLCLGLVRSANEPAANEYAPILIDSDQVAVTSYRGIIAENQEKVTLTPALRALDNDKEGGARFICGYKIFADESALIPFAIILKSHKTGEADIVLEHGVFLDYEIKNVYQFNISAYDCGTVTRMSDKIPVHITVHEFSQPIWQEEAYFAEIEEGKPEDTIIQVQAYERHKTAGNRICDYKILTPNEQFTIDKQGNIKLKPDEKLVYAERHNHILAVQATDCMGRDSKPVMVNFIIRPECKIGWQGIADKIDYYPGVGRVDLAADARFDKCRAPCKETRVTTSVYLKPMGPSQSCDHDVKSIKTQKKLCGAMADGVDLLPPPDQYASWTNDHPETSDDTESREDVYSFDGETNAVKVPDGKVNHTLTEHFTLMLWMKHGQNMNSNRENLVCNADGEEMSRHHYALFIRNCHLIFLLRQEFSKKDFDVFKPAEWRWRIDEVCDGKWHHYAVSVDFPEVRLYVDGRLFMSSKNNPTVVDDWPLHRARKIHFTELVVGACWEGGEKRLSQFFKGHMAGLTLNRERTESDTVIQCLNNCKEKLDFHSLYMMEGGMSISYNSPQTEFTINSRNMSQVRKILSEVGYINYRMFPVPGKRDVKIHTDVECEGADPLVIPDVSLSVMVNQGSEPVITITGGKNIMPYERQLKKGGVKLYPGLTIMETMSKNRETLKKKIAENFVSQTLLKGKVFAENEATRDAKPEFRLDQCSVTPEATLTKEEVLTFPGNLVKRLGLQARTGPNGLRVSGSASVVDYQTLVREIHYISRTPDMTRQRVFTLRCSNQNGRYASNRFAVTVTVIHTQPKKPVEHVAHAQENTFGAQHPQPVETFHHGQSEVNLNNQEKQFIGRTNNFNAVVITVICVGFLMFMIILGVIRIRDAHNKTQVVHVEEKDGDEMEWDNSALTITVNPMDGDGDMMGENFNEFEQTESRMDDSESDDDSSYRDDDLETSEDEAVEKVPRTQLEWDDSGLTF